MVINFISCFASSILQLQFAILILKFVRRHFDFEVLMLPFWIAL